MADDFNDKYDALFNTAVSAGVPFPSDPEFARVLKKIIPFSDFICRNFLQYPELLSELAATGDLLTRYGSGDFNRRLEAVLAADGGGREESAPGPASGDFEKSVMSSLRAFRRREMIRIAWRDLSGLADLSETMTDLSALAEAIIDSAFDLLYRQAVHRYGQPVNAAKRPQNIVVMGMGKLGACELNFSSDVDLIFTFPEDGFTVDTPQPIPNLDFFTRLCRQFIYVIGEPTREGFVYRVDVRLRPFGESGPLVMSFDAMEDYYQSQGREWERYALIKSRVVAGDKQAGEDLMSRLKPFVYRRYLDYGAFESIRDMKKKISSEVKRRDLRNNIKLGAGGIREVEFFGQVFQLIRGGVLISLQERRIREVLKILVKEKYIPEPVSQEMIAAYEFLRTVENRLQAYADQQTHDLPVNPEERTRLAASMGYEHWEDFKAALMAHMQVVHTHFNSLLQTETNAPEKEQDEDSPEALPGLWFDSGNDHQWKDLLVDSGYTDPEEVIRLLENLRNDSTTRSLNDDGRERLNRLVPLVLKEAGKAGNPLTVLKRIIDLIKAIERRINYLSLLLENPGVLPHLIRLSSASPWIVSFLARHPVLLDELVDPRALYAPVEKDQVEREIKKRLEPIDSDDLERQIETLCILKQVNTLHVAAADITGVLPLMRVSDYLTYVAESVLNEVLSLSRHHLVQKHGQPVCRLNQLACDTGFAVIAYGKLGGWELGYASDLDLVFLHAGEPGQTQGGKRPIENGYFFARLGQRFVHTLTTRTAAGALYDIDMRLRPSGSSGILVSHVDAFEEYQLKEAWTWEHQALIKARGICGDPVLLKRFERIRKKVLARHRDKATLCKAVKDMRERMRKELGAPQPDRFDLKQGVGGMVDIEFLVQYLVLLLSHKYPPLLTWTDNVRLLQTLIETGIIGEYTAHLLKHAYLIYRAMAHKLSLQQKDAMVPEPRFADIREKVAEIWTAYMEDGVSPSIMG
jgi:glutamate-ammonia-ligase adenylyltransferase